VNVGRREKLTKKTILKNTAVKKFYIQVKQLDECSKIQTKIRLVLQAILDNLQKCFLIVYSFPFREKVEDSCPEYLRLCKVIVMQMILTVRRRICRRE